MNKELVLTISIILVTAFTIDNIYSSKHPNMGDGITHYKNSIIYKDII